ncbi:hypothetical protein OG413_38225 [Streptomyces sp. NBC_01433]|uniref:hypothetical protein n=1 Tax=Streptomyces sp. NBC_01433 TaxID=2903864 RepID=UPI00224EB6B5|nr:hypothetical protein [Streptomyces sp. NBC_01433]MCX4681048.1 hypothetical protein [Streptomyces sp. NBC_01433]
MPFLISFGPHLADELPAAGTGRLMRAGDLREALDLPILPESTEGEPEPGLFTQPHP